MGGATRAVRRGDSLVELRAGLIDRTEDLCSALLGSPASRAGRQWRWGSNGAIAVDVRGAKRGIWIDHRDGQGGDLLDLVQRQRGGTFPDTLAFARAFLRLPAAEPSPRPSAQPDSTDASRIVWARRLAGETVPVAGTIAETYLVEIRGIAKPEGGWPEAVRYHPGRRALLLVATTTAGAVQAVQLVYLTPDAQKISAEEAKRCGRPERAKQSFGVLAGGAVRLAGDAAGPVLVAEGPETALSVWAATGHETWVTLGTGNVPKLTPPAGRPVVVARDDDKQWSPADRVLRKAVDAWRAAGAVVHVATPWPARRQDKSDFNDVLQADGAAAVRARIEVALRPAAGVRWRQNRQAARDVLAGAIHGFVAAETAYDPDSDAAPPVHAIRADLGIGKSRAARAMLARRLAAMRMAGDRRTAAVAVPTHQLGEEQAAAFEASPEARAAGLTAAVWRSRDASDPSAPERRMCRNIEAVADARAAGANVQTAACRRQMPDGTTASCPHFENCAFQAQRHRTADLWFVAHELPYSQKPGAIGKLALLVVDEAPWAAGLRLDPVTLPLDALGVLDQRPGDEQSANWAVLQHHRSRAADALRGLTDGPLIGEAFELTAAEAAEARALEWARKQHVDMIPGMPAAARKAALKAAESNRTIARLALFWTALEALLCDGGPRESGWAALATESTEAGPVRVLALTGRKPVREGWQVPTLLLDATMNIDLVRPFWPQVELTADVATKAPWQRIRQVGDFSYSKRRLAPAPDAAPADQRRRARNLRSLHATLAAYARRFAPGRVLVVAQKAVEEALPTVGPLPTGVELAHHNAVAGRDEWGPAPHRAGVRALVVVGRTLPPPADVERMAEALTGRAVTPLPGWYPRIAATRETTGGAVSAEADRHPDPIAEAIRWQICEGELLQIIGRGRGVNRTEVDPVEVLVLTDAVLPLLVDQLLASADLAPGPVELMLSAGGVALDCAADAARAYPTLWPSHAAVKKAFRRSEGDNSELEFLLYGNVPLWTLKRARYQRAGARQPRVALTFDPDLVPDLRAWLEERLGALASYEIEGAPAPAQLRPAPAPPPPPQDHTARLRALSIRLEAASPAARLATLVARLEAVRPRPPPPWRRSPPARPPAPQLVAA